MTVLLDVDITVAAPGQTRPRVAAAFSLAAGITALTGPSGAGKSSCLAAIAGLLRPDRGRVVLGTQVLFDAANGIDVPCHRRGIVLVGQRVALFPHMDIVANVAYGAPRTLAAKDRRAHAREWLERMHVAHVAGRRPAALSGGEAQRVALARALAAGPQALLLDEPFSALDDELRQQLRIQIAGLVTSLALPTILVTHDVRDVAALATQVLTLRDGSLVA